MSQKVNRNLGLQTNFLKLLKTFSTKKSIVLPLEHLHKGETSREKSWLERCWLVAGASEAAFIVFPESLGVRSRLSRTEEAVPTCSNSKFAWKRYRFILLAVHGGNSVKPGKGKEASLLSQIQQAP